jgi:hypothetical protein
MVDIHQIKGQPILRGGGGDNKQESKTSLGCHVSFNRRSTLPKRRRSMLDRWTSSEESNAPLVDKCPGRWDSPVSSPIIMASPSRISERKTPLGLVSSTDPLPPARKLGTQSAFGGSLSSWGFPNLLETDVPKPSADDSSPSTCRWKSPPAASSTTLPSPRRILSEDCRSTRRSNPSSTRSSFRTCATDPTPTRNLSIDSLSFWWSGEQSSSSSTREANVPEPPANSPTLSNDSSLCVSCGNILYKDQTPKKEKELEHYVRRSAAEPRSCQYYSFQSKESADTTKSSRRRSKPGPPSWGALAERSASLRRLRSSCRRKQDPEKHCPAFCEPDSSTAHDQGHAGGRAADLPKEIFVICSDN